ncbi:MAG: hypothetical protein HZA95_03405 [Candidatus Vogelbacteria bacterium]|nr:hypothetical protein [Candidatus Vogelbacteria bacterium]
MAEESQTKPEDNLLAERALASHAMEGELHRRTVTEEEIAKVMNVRTDGPTNIQNFTMELARQRQLAEAAMEGPEHKKAREAKELEKRAREEAIKREQEEKERALRMKREEASELERITSEARERQRKALDEKKATVDQLLKSPSMSIRPVRTYKDDMSEAMKGGNFSLVGMAIKEDEKRREKIEEVTEEKKESHLFAILSTILILGALGIGGYLVYTKILRAPNSVDKAATSGYIAPVFSEKVNTLVLDNKTDTQLMAAIKSDVRNISAPIGTMQAERIVNSEVDNIDITFQRFASFLRLRAPASLVRNIDPEFMIGIHSSAESTGFVYLKPTNYETVFAGMLEWEPSIMRDLYGMLTGKTPDDSLLKLKFTDAVIKNVDARVAKNETGQTVFMYSFFTQNTLIISTNEGTFTEVITRLTTPRPRIQR